ncbi:hypothetical protein G9394_11890 [Proteus vulgaris]|nr:hypothetical protein G9394_11890 [Proteus vulgaris]
MGVRLRLAIKFVGERTWFLEDVVVTCATTTAELPLTALCSLQRPVIEPSPFHEVSAHLI